MLRRVRLVLSTVLLCALAGVVTVSCAGESAEHGPTDEAAGGDLLAGHDWSHFAGTAVRDDGLHIAGLGRRIVQQDGSGGQDNPPVNLRGPHLRVQGDFQVTAVLDRPGDQTASLCLYGDVPIVYDEWRQNRRGLCISVTGNELRLRAWDGTSAAPVLDQGVAAELSRSVTVALARQAGTLVLSAGAARLSVTDPGVFGTGQVYFGADATPGGPGWTLSRLTATGADVVAQDAPALRQPAPPADALRTLAAATGRKLPIGAAIAAAPLMSDDGYRQLAAGQFSMLTTENDLKPQFVHPQPDVYDFTEGDLLVDFADANAMSVHAHTLVFGEANPRWMQDAPAGDRERIMRDHVTTVVGHYRGRVAEWDVVNEPLAADDDGLRPHLWQQAMGEQYIDIAFAAAHAADPGAKLYLNEFGLEADGPRWDQLYALVTRLVQRGVPIHGVGFQTHIHESGDHVDPAVLRDHIRDLAALGLSARVSEIDVHGDDSEAQADQYGVVLQACLAEPTCTSYTTWGITDRYGSTAEPDSYPLRPGDELMWDEHLSSKPAVDTLRVALRAGR